MGARWYSNRTGRWVSADTIVPDPSDPRGLNRFAYVLGNPIRYVDPSGHGVPVPPRLGFEIGTGGWAPWMVDAARVALTVAGFDTVVEGDALAAEQSFRASVMLAGTVSPGASGGANAVANAVANAAQGAVQTAGPAAVVACAVGDCTNEISASAQAAKHGFGALSHAAEFGVQTYNSMRNLIKGTGLQAHHIIETRLASRLGLDMSKMPTVALTRPEHQVLTNAWRDAIGYTNSSNPINTANATLEQIWAAAQLIYADFPELLEAASQALGR
jgi:hypothetical protein